MKVLATPEVVDLVRDRGGRLYVWTDPRRCCGGGMTYLLTASQARPGRTFKRVPAEGFQLLFDSGSMQPPEELHLEVKGRRTKRVEAYWNGCVFAV